MLKEIQVDWVTKVQGGRQGWFLCNQNVSQTGEDVKHYRGIFKKETSGKIFVVKSDDLYRDFGVDTCTVHKTFTYLAKTYLPTNKPISGDGSEYVIFNVHV